MTVPEQRIIQFLYLLGIQNDHAVRLKHLGNQIYFQFNQMVPNNISDLKKIRDAGPKIDILTLMHGFGKKQEVCCSLLFFF